MQIIQDEYEETNPEAAQTRDMYAVFSQQLPIAVASGTTVLDQEASDDLRRAIIQGVNELIDELESVYVNVSEKAVEHIHSK